eukprot:CAMPEP_0173387616 /NCGR_PEP_ID=MMETSP1356-20130122/10086_1 /TAXON_ID=77927 ORGANISM="Hemiselmis virescens, Strain PCC157" /NCGR_SAMPLE_ID=MMETSP1356 /ASSEMBLY_ACC=CAM_ASM_000847 /LENGTH=885 /DNA_ID=CAMNT_0014344285 /DNA_START=107 /DNA_END=2764 /DNA_ORIENTATION=+
MIRSSYTRCDPATATRALDYFYTSACKGGVPLPPTINNLPCNTTCGPGQFLSLGASGCSDCDPGTYSIGGGYKFTNWEAMPEGMTTLCRFQLDADETQPCTGWVLNGTFVYSGNMRGLRLMDSVLQYKADFTRSGSVEFEYKVDAERRWDGIFFQIDGKKVMDLTSYKFQYTKVTHPVDPGFHTLEWVYHKDVAYEMGEDMAWIKSIQVSGTLDNAQRCNVCPKGSYSVKGADKCEPCPMNTFSSKSSSASCTACTGSKFSYPGSSACKPAKGCRDADIQVAYSACSGGKRTRTYSYTQPKICAGGKGLPAAAQVDCAACSPGTYREGAECNYCPAGTFNGNQTFEGSKVCAKCPSGTIARKVRYYDNIFQKEKFDQLVAKGEMGTGCANGFCGTGGWRPVGDMLDTGVGNGAVADIWMSLQVDIQNQGEVQFTFNRVSSNPANYLQLYIDEEHIWSVESEEAWEEDTKKPITFSAPVESGKHIITWVFHKERQYSWMDEDTVQQTTDGGEDRVQLTSIIVKGAKEGGASQCLVCPKGHVANAQSSLCDPCRPGTHTDPARPGVCSPCPKGTFSSEWGSEGCLRCGHGTFSAAGSSSCDVSPSHCVYEAADGVSYDLGGLARVNQPMWGPVHDGNNSVDYYINVCSKAHSNGTCHGRDGIAVPGYACQQNTLIDSYGEYGYGWDDYGDFDTSSLTVSLGDVMAFYSLKGNPKGGLVVSYQGGTPCRDGRSRTLNITMTCDMEVGPGTPTTVPNERVEVQKCGYQLAWRSQYACPMCTLQDMESLPGECSVTGQRPITMVWKEPRRCHGGLALPSVRYEECVAVMLDKGKIALIAVGGAAVLSLLVGALITLYLRNRKIYKEYSVLKEQNEAEVELERYTLDDDDA